MKPANRTGNREPEPSGTEPSEAGLGRNRPEPEPSGTGTARNRNRLEPPGTGTVGFAKFGLWSGSLGGFGPGTARNRNCPEPEPPGTGTQTEPSAPNRADCKPNRTESNRGFGAQGD